jgi:hypothetical protein
VTGNLIEARTRQCTRFRRDGEPCGNFTASADGWCRQEGCLGFVRPAPLLDENHDKRAPRGTAKPSEATGALPLDLDIDEVEDVRVSQRARDSFRFHRRGSDAEAEVQLRAMLEDFLLHGARSVRRSGFVILARSCFELFLDPSLGTITGYETVHRERTWEQVKAKVPSRYGNRKANRVKRQGLTPPPDRGPVLTPVEVLAVLDPAAVYLFGRVLDSYARVRKVKGLDDDGLDRALRFELASGLTGARVGPGTDKHLVHLVAGDLTWLITPDAAAAVGVRRTREADDEAWIIPASY